MATSRFENTIDKVFLIYIVIITVFGLAALISASGPLGVNKFGDSFFYVKRQIVSGLLPGLALFFLLLKINYEKWRKFSWVIYVGAVLLLALVFVPGIGATINGAKSWLSIFGKNFQPSEIAKLALIIFGAYLLSDRKRNLQDWQMGVMPILTLLSPVLLLVFFQPDMGTLFIMLVILFAMMLVAKVPKKYLFVLGSLAIIAFVVMVVAKPYRMDRLTIFMHPEIDPLGVGYQINQAFLAVGSGGVWGTGIGMSRQKYQYLPEVNSDSIFAIIAEETGFIFSTVLIILITLIGLRGLKIAKNADSEFGRLLATGIVVWLIWQSFLNIGAMVGILPLTGVPLPFISHGGSALLAELAAVGLILNISKKV